MNILMRKEMSLDHEGIWFAVCSGALASGFGYAVWYTVLPALKATSAATIQLSVPVFAALGGIALLGEMMTMRLTFSSVAILGGIALVVLERQILARLPQSGT
jgi:drug/metabolite transporter (DMT)-like permease